MGGLKYTTKYKVEINADTIDRRVTVIRGDYRKIEEKIEAQAFDLDDHN